MILKLDPAWRRLPKPEREKQKDETRKRIARLNPTLNAFVAITVTSRGLPLPVRGRGRLEPLRRRLVDGDASQNRLAAKPRFLPTYSSIRPGRVEGWSSR
jgi:hypothetical protein